MIKYYLIAATLLLTMVAASQAEVDFDFNGNVILGAWWAKEYNFTDDWYWDENGDSIPSGKDPYPTSYTDIVPAGALGFDFKTDRLQFAFELGAGVNCYDFRHAFSATSGWFYNKRFNLMAMVRKFYGEWNINDSTPCNFSASNQALYCGNGFSNTGVLTTGSRPLLQFKADKGIGDAFNITGKVAAILPDTLVFEVAAFDTKDTVVNGTEYAKVTMSQLLPKDENYKASVKIPKLEGYCGINFEHEIIGFALDVAAGYQNYKVIRRPKAHSKIEAGNYPGEIVIESYILGGNTSLKIGPVTAGFTYSGGKNLRPYGVMIGNPFRWRGLQGSQIITVFYPYAKTPTLDDQDLIVGDLIDPDRVDDVDKIDNSFSQEMAWILNVRPFEFLGGEGGYGMIKAYHEHSGTNSFWHNTRAFYGQISWKILEVITLTPEGGYYFYGPEINQGSFTYWGFNTSVEF